MAEKKSDEKKLTLDAVKELHNKQYGKGSVYTGTEAKRDLPRIPTGIFAVDYATGGGVPIHGSMCAWGPDSGGKTGLGLSAVAMVPRICFRCFGLLDFCSCSLPPMLMRSFFADVEGSLNREWGACIGAEPKSYLVGLGEYGEQYLNMAETALRADDCGLVVVDSLAALVPSAEFDAALEDQFIGNQAKLITRGVKKLKQRLIRERKREHPCAVFFTNQMRSKIGVMFGSPESMPGGWALRHEFSILLRCVKKNMDDKRDAKYLIKGGRDLAVRHAFAVKKEKVQTLASTGEFLRLKENVPEVGLRKGQIDDFNTVLSYAREYGVVAESGRKWQFGDKTFSTLREVQDLWKVEEITYFQVQLEIVKRAKARLAGAE